MSTRHKNNSLIPIERIENRILFIRGHKVMLDSDLAEIYGVETGAFNQAIKRNSERFPLDFMFQLTRQELTTLISQNVISNEGRGGIRKLPYVFTEHGAIMAASILKSKRAVQVSVTVVRAFVRMRDMIETNTKFAVKLKELEDRLDMHDGNTIAIMETLRKLLKESKGKAAAPSKKIGFDTIPQQS
jgi:hypothetical protein